MTKRHIITIIALLLFTNIFSQEQPYSKLYIFDQTLLNPAVGAKYDFLSIKLTGAEQWMKLPENPQIQNLSINSKFKNSNMGINATLMNNSYGIVRYSGLKFSYFYFTKLSVRGDYISYGIYGSVFQFSFDTRNLSSTTADPTLQNQLFTNFYPNAGLGIYYSQKYFSLGISAGNLFPYKPDFFDNTYEPLKAQTIYLYGDTRLTNEIKTLAYEPSVMIYIDKNFKRELHINNRFIINNQFWLGISYRDALSFDNYSTHNVLAMIGARFFNKLHFGYSYDLNLFSARTVLGGSHNIMIGYDFVKKRRIYPMYF